MKQVRLQQGFTMIELIMVIVILGVLSAFALPKFADLGGSARVAAIEGLAGSMRSAVGISRAATLAAGDGAATSVTLDGSVIALTNGFPAATDDATDFVDVTGIILAAGLADNAAVDAASYTDGAYSYAYVLDGVITVFNTASGAAATNAAGASLDCGIVYSIVTAPPTVITETAGC